MVLRQLPLTLGALGLSSAQVSLNFLFRLLGFPFAQSKQTNRTSKANAQVLLHFAPYLRINVNTSAPKVNGSCRRTMAFTGRHF